MYWLHPVNHCLQQSHLQNTPKCLLWTNQVLKPHTNNKIFLFSQWVKLVNTKCNTYHKYCYQLRVLRASPQRGGDATKISLNQDYRNEFWIQTINKYGHFHQQQLNSQNRKKTLFSENFSNLIDLNFTFYTLQSCDCGTDCKKFLHNLKKIFKSHYTNMQQCMYTEKKFV